VVLLFGIGFVAGVITAVSPCVLPVLPIVLAGGAAGGTRRRPYAIIGGLVLSFTVFTLSASALLTAAGLPQDTLHDVAIALLFVVAATLLVPRLGMAIEAPLARLSRRPSGDLGGGFLLGVSLGLVFVPCAGPVLATVSVLAAEHRVGVRLVLLTLCYAAGAGTVLLLVALGGQRVTRRLRQTRWWWRPALGIVMAAAAFAIVFNLDQTLQTRLGSYTTALQRDTEESTYATKHLSTLRGARGGVALKPTAATRSAPLPVYLKAPNFVGISHWLNTPGGTPLTIAGLHGKVVLVDFWTYSCINCLRTLPHLRAWYAAYHKHGLEIVGVHTPEFAFEHVLPNVEDAVRRLDVTWPVALDNDYRTWTAWSNQYWPADYLVDQNGNVRAYTFGEGDYTKTENDIRRLLAIGGRSTDVPNATPTELQTPETYLGPERLDPARYVGTKLVPDRAADYRLARSVPQNDISYGGVWTLSGQTATAGLGARLALHYHAEDVYIVLAGHGRIFVTRNGRPLPPIDVTGAKLYTVLSSTTATDGVLQFVFPPGIRAYSFTFG
jgi:cytochrome c biogenesis protein CcdA/thiol-disulfide isomerase/thioredoxin